MSFSGAISVRDLSKEYKRYRSPWGRLFEWGSLGRYQAHQADWVLRGISFDVGPGSAVGIIGQNGAGKSTLLKILAGATVPTGGTFEVSGRLAALLELGMGFHPDFSGSQNAIMALQMSGLPTDGIAAVMPEVRAFSELHDYMEQPLRTYSTGMQMRLAFSVATAIRPDVLIVDEALAVGDAYFQHKSMSRIRRFKEQGTSILLVSHDPLAVRSLCDRALLVDAGVVARDGSPDSVLDYYNALIARKEKDQEILQIEGQRGRSITRSGSGRARIADVQMLNRAGEPRRAFQVGEEAVIRCKVEFRVPITEPTIGILIRDRLGNDAFGTNTHEMDVRGLQAESGDEWTVDFALRLNLGCGGYSLTAAVHTRDSHVEENFDWVDGVLVFQVLPGAGHRFIGTAALPVDVDVARSPKRG
jgi:homopolymeric O-antigen transport system ATP-binding protein